MVFGELDAEMGDPEAAVEAWDQQVGIDELDAVIAAKMPALVVPPVGIALRMALRRIDNERFRANFEALAASVLPANYKGPTLPR